MVEPSMNSRTRTFTSSEIIEITSNFKTMIGKGGFGEVYFGTLKDGTDVAVKVLLSSSEQRRKDFQTEAKLLTDVHQQNLVSVEGYCDEDGKEALILEYMSNGTLKQHLSEKSERVLIWIQRLHIALDVARGLEYLHGREPPIVHRDLKPDNILLNKNMEAKIADFGLSRAFATESTSHISTEHLAGTAGYRDFDSYNTGHIRKGNDVYSFGIILLELVTGKPAIITRDKDEWITIIKWIDPFVKKGDIRKIVDPRLNGEFNIGVARKVIEIAVSCVKPINERPDISQISTKLKECLDIEVGFSSASDDTSRPNILVRLYRNIRQRQKGAIMKSMEEQQRLNLGNVRIFTRAEVATIALNFKEVIEEGPFNKVYRGFLNGGAPVAVKIWSPSSSWLEDREFLTQVELSSHLCHRNVVSAVGYLYENNIKALIYEFMANGDLRQHLSGKYERILRWNERLQIAIDIAHGLEYLQTGSKTFVVHGDLKSSAILLNEKMQGKIAGFELAQFLHEEFEEIIGACGTSGYLDPVFGIILLELLTGWPALEFNSSLEYNSPLHIAVRVASIMETGDIKRLVDPRLQGKFNTNTASKVAKLAMSCASRSADQRPDLSHVLVELKECLALEMHSQQTEGIQIIMEGSDQQIQGIQIVKEESDQQIQGIQIVKEGSQDSDSDEFYLKVKHLARPSPDWGCKQTCTGGEGVDPKVFSYTIGNNNSSFPLYPCFTTRCSALSIITLGDSTADVGNNDYISPPFSRLITLLMVGTSSITNLLAGFAKEIYITVGANFASAASGYDDKASIINHTIPLSQQLEYYKDYPEKTSKDGWK
ncbi:hypothetical protein SLE2022_309820 [Rubroshorea leprosula]